MNTIKDETTERMQKCMDSLSNQFNKIRTGRANPSILDSVKVDYYGNQTPINQTANISVEENRTLVISPWDKTCLLYTSPSPRDAHESRMPSSA